MTLRHRLLLAYCAVVLICVATVGVIALELRRSRQIHDEFQRWNGFVLAVQKLRSAVPTTEIEIDDEVFLSLLHREGLNLPNSSDFVDTERVRTGFYEVYLQYSKWKDLPPVDRTNQIHLLTNAIDNLGHTIEIELNSLNTETETQASETQLLLIAVALLMGLIVLWVGLFLRRSFLKPMQQLERQVEALGRDQPPTEPLLTSPPEMANLAEALDRARLSLRDMREQLLDAERLTTIGQFAAQLAHNLRNPLASIRAIAQVTARQNDDKQTAERMRDVMASADRLDRWVARLMEVARGKPTPPQRADVLPTLSRIRDGLLSEATAKDLTLTIDAPAGELVCLHDPQTLEHALVAIVTNAIEASPLGATVAMKAEIVRDDTHTDSRTICQITVTDEGPGLPSEDPERVFEFSYSTKVRGMGLGLALARQALKRQGAEAHAANRKERGAIFQINLPIDAPSDPSKF